MKVNMTKTKIVVFRKGGHLARNELWTFGETAIEVVNAYKYLRLYFSTKLSTSVMVSELMTKANKYFCTKKILMYCYTLNEFCLNQSKNEGDLNV